MTTPTGERIRDKIAASKRKGIWMGGSVPLGYRVENRALHIVEDHAAFVRDLFRRYLELGSVVRLQGALDAKDVRLPLRPSASGKPIGGGRLGRGQLYAILSNPIYLGKLRHKGQIHDGQHDGIIDLDIWERVRAKLAEQAHPRNGHHRDDSFLLAGKLFDDQGNQGNRMGATYAAKGSRRWRYYVSRAVSRGRTQEAGSVRRVAATEIEWVVTDALRKTRGAAPNDRIADRREMAPSSLATRSDHPHQHPASTAPAPSARGPSPDQSSLDAVERIAIGAGALEIRFQSRDDADAFPTLVIPWTPASPHRRREIIPGENVPQTDVRPMRTTAQTVLIESLGDANHWLDELIRDPQQSIAAIAAREGKTERSIRMTLSLAFADPRLIQAAIERRLPRGFGVKRLTELPMLWSAQWGAVGLRAPV